MKKKEKKKKKKRFMFLAVSNPVRGKNIFDFYLHFFLLKQLINTVTQTLIFSSLCLSLIIIIIAFLRLQFNSEMAAPKGEKPTKSAGGREKRRSCLFVTQWTAHTL